MKKEFIKVKCDCTAAEKCPQGKTGIDGLCYILVEKEEKPKRTKVDHLLSKLAEECGEVVQEIMKVQNFIRSMLYE